MQMKRALFAVLIGLICLTLPVPTAFGSEVRFHFIAVGHGDAILIEQDRQAVALVDAGPPESAAVVLGYLRDQGVDSLAHLFITHTHDDHIGGVPALLDSIPIAQIHITGMAENREAVESLNHRLRDRAVGVDTLGAGDLPVSMGDLTMEVLNPIREATAGKQVAPNPNSMVLLVRHDSVQVLLTADIDQDREKQLIREYGAKLRSFAMKASHHASPYGNGADFLKTVAPQIIVVTVGSSQWRYPSPQTLERLRQHCSIVLRTDEVGTVILQSDARSLKVISPQMDAP
jgi:competence protein ComEC